MPLGILKIYPLDLNLSAKNLFLVAILNFYYQTGSRIKNEGCSALLPAKPDHMPFKF